MTLHTLIDLDVTVVSDQYVADVVIVGSGAGGAVAFARLVERGLNVIIIEEGHPFGSGSYPYAISTSTRLLYRNAGLNPIFGRPMVPFGEGRCLGGTTEINGGLVWRTPDHLRAEWCDSLGLQEVYGKCLDPHFEYIERRLGVSTLGTGRAGNRDSALLRYGAEQIGWKVVDVPRAAPLCQHSNRCGSGCPTGAKQTMSQTFLPDGVSGGGKLFTGLRVQRVVSAGRGDYRLICYSATDGKISTFVTRRVILSGGTTQTPQIVKRSGLGNRVARFCFHLNLKILAEFDEPVNPTNSTIFTHQVQEFLEDRQLMMATNLSPEYLAMAFSHLGQKVLQERIDCLNNSALYTLQIAPTSRGHLFSLGNEAYMFNSFNKHDFGSIQLGLKRLSEIIFTAGATQLYLPIIGASVVKSHDEACRLITGAKGANFVASSVHAMSSMQMGTNPKNSLVRPDGRIWNTEGVYVLDASILPSWTIESPQGSIMAVSSLLASEI